MSYLRYVLRRAAFAVFSVYLIVTATFLLGSLTIRNEINNVLAQLRYNGASAAELERAEQRLVETYGLDHPIHERLINWYVDVTTLNWGESIETGEPVVALLRGPMQVTLEYVIPGVVVAMVLGVLLGLFAALLNGGVFDWSVRLSAYVILGIPVFVLVIYMQYVGGWQIQLVGNWVVELVVLGDKTLAALAVALSLIAGQLRFSRASALEQTGESFVKMLRAKGANRLRLARHVLRNATIPIISLSISELLAVLVLNIYVIEAVVGLRGLGQVTLTAATTSDIPLLIWSVMVVVLLGISASFIQDVLHGYLDPRIRAS